MYTHMCMYIYIYNGYVVDVLHHSYYYTHMCVYIYIYIYICIHVVLYVHVLCIHFLHPDLAPAAGGYFLCTLYDYACL